MADALEGLKVADFSWAAAAPVATRMLADHGATVVRVESRSHVDSVRITAPFPDNKPGLNRSGFFADFNSSKYGISLDLKKPEAYGVARRLIEWADVVVESFTPRVMAGWRLSYNDIVQWKPGVIMLSSCMQGQTGPYREYPGFGGQGAALAGLHYLTGWPDRVPAGPKGAYTDTIAPRYTVAAILAAVDYRERTGIGQHIDFAQVEAAIGGFLGIEVLDYAVNGRVARPPGNRSDWHLLHGSFACAGNDRWITICIETEAQLRALCGLMGYDGDPDEAAVEAWTRGQDAFELTERLQAVGIAAAPIQKAEDLFRDPQLAHRGHFVPLDHVEMGRVAYNGPAHQLSGTPARLRWAAPCLGEHTRRVLKDFLGYADDEIDRLEAEGLLN